LTFKITKYEEATLKLENQNTTINILQKEVQKLKEEAKQETTLLINSRIRQLTTEEEKNVDISFQNEYNVFLKIKGVEELDKKLKEIITLNQKYAIENGKLKIQFEDILYKYKSLIDDKKEKIKKNL